MRVLRLIAGICVCSVLCMPVFAIEETAEALGLASCIELAIKNSPQIKKNIYNLEIAKGNVGIAKSVYFPTLGAQASVFQEYNSNSNYLSSKNSELPSAQVVLSQLLWNFGKSNSLIKMEKFYQLVGEYNLANSIYNTVFDVKRNYYAVLKAQARVVIEEDFLKILERNLERSIRIAHKGMVEQSDMINARSLLTDERIRVIDAHNEYKNALINLANSLYIDTTEISVKNNEYFKEYKVPTPDSLRDYPENECLENKEVLADLLKKVKTLENSSEFPIDSKKAYKLALKNSPDLWALESVKKAMDASLTYIKRQYYPDLTGDVGYGFNNYRRFSNHGFFMGLNLRSTLNMKQLKHEIDVGKAQIALAQNAVDLFRRDLFFDIERCLVNLINVEKQLPVALLNVEHSLENFAIADECYEKGIEDYNLLQDARNAYLDAQNLYIETLYDYNIKLIDLENAMHYHIDGMHELVRNIKPYISKDNLEHYEKLIEYEEL